MATVCVLGAILGKSTFMVTSGAGLDTNAALAQQFPVVSKNEVVAILCVLDIGSKVSAFIATV